MSKMDPFTSKTIMRPIPSDDLSQGIRRTPLLTRTFKLSLGHQFIKHNKTFKHLQFSETDFELLRHFEIMMNKKLIIKVETY